MVREARACARVTFFTSGEGARGGVKLEVSESPAARRRPWCFVRRGRGSRPFRSIAMPERRHPLLADALLRRGAVIRRAAQSAEQLLAARSARLLGAHETIAAQLAAQQRAAAAAVDARTLSHARAIIAGTAAHAAAAPPAGAPACAAAPAQGLATLGVRIPPALWMDAAERLQFFNTPPPPLPPPPVVRAESLLPDDFAPAPPLPPARSRRHF